MVLGALGQPAQSFATDMHDNINEPDILWLVVAAVTMCIFSFLCGCAIGCQFHDRLRGMLALWRSSNDVDSNLDAATRRRYFTSPLSECSDPDLWMRLNHHSDLPDDSESEASECSHHYGFGAENFGSAGLVCGLCGECSQTED